MKNRKWMCLPLLLMALFVFSPAAYADLYWESEMKSAGAAEGFPKNLPKQMREQMTANFKPGTEIIKSYLSSHAFRTETPDNIMIMQFDSMNMYQIDPGEKTYVKFDLAAMGANKGKMPGNINMDMNVKPTKDTKEIAGYKCKKYNVTIMGADSEYWVSKDVKGYKEFRAMNEKMEKMAEKSPMLKQMNMAGMMNKLDGFPVQTVVTAMGVKTTTTLKSIEKKSLNKNLFKVPKDYKLRQTKMPFMKK